MSRRAWGFWTKNKLDILGDYLDAFNVASQRARKTVYLDLFAGTAENEARDTGQPILGSACRALDARPQFTRILLFELQPTTAAELRTTLASRYPDRAFDVIPGDSNDTLADALQGLADADLRWAPTFAFLDPYNVGIHWSTLEALADFKRGKKYKVELFILCFSSAMPRILTTAEDPDPIGAQQMTAFFGTEQWKAIRDGRVNGDLDGGQARDEYVNLLRYRLQHVLDYKYTHSFEIKNAKGTLYHLILATDNDTGFKIMNDLYRRAAREHAVMRRENGERKRQEKELILGVTSFFTPDEVANWSDPSDDTYSHEPPWEPYGSA